MNLKRRYLLVIPLFFFIIVNMSKIPLYSEITSTVSGKVVDEETGKGIKEVEVVLYKYTGSIYVPRDDVYRTVTDSDGKFTIFEIPPAIYKMRFFPPSPYAWKKKTKDPSAYDEIVVARGKNISILKKLKIGGVLKIRTFDLHNNEPIVGVWLHLKGASLRANPKVGDYSNAQGEFVVDRLDEGIYTLHARKEGFGMKSIEVEIHLKETTYIEIPFDSKSPTGVYGYLSCKDSGLPLKDIRLSLVRRDQYGRVHCYTDENGFYSAVDFEPGEYEISLVGDMREGETNGEPVFIKKPVKIVEGKKRTTNLSLDCSLEYKRRRY